MPTILSDLTNLAVDLSLKYPLEILVLILVSCRTLGTTALTGGTVATVPPPPRYL